MGRDNNGFKWYSMAALVFITLTIGSSVFLQYLFDPTQIPTVLITASSALATVIMIIFIAKQLELTQETLEETMKERVDLEALKCAIRGYLKRGVVDAFGASSFYQHGINRCDLFLRDMYRKRYGGNDLSPEEWGKIIRICTITKVLLERWVIYDKIQRVNWLIQENRQLGRDKGKSQRALTEIHEEIEELKKDISNTLLKRIENDRDFENEIVEILKEGY